MEFLLSCFKSWKMMLWKCCTQYASKFGKLSNGHRTGKGQFLFQCQKCSNYSTIALISHASKVMLKIFQARLQKSVNWELPDVQAVFRKGRGTRDWSKKQESSRKNLLLLHWLRQSPWLWGSQQTVENPWRDGSTRPPDLPPAKSEYRLRSNS